MMKMSKGIWSVILLVLIAVSPLFVVNAGPSNATLQVENEEGFKVISNGMITVAFPENGTKPMFFWWSGEKNSSTYLMKYQNLEESWISLGQFKHDLMINDDVDYKEQFGKLLENTSLVKAQGRLNSASNNMVNLGQLMKNLSINSDRKDVNATIDKIGSLIDEIKKWPDSSTKDMLLTDLNSMVLKMKELQTEADQGSNKDKVKFNKTLKEIVDLLNNNTKKVGEQVSLIEKFKSGNTKPLHPYQFPFSKGVWTLEGPSDIKAGNKIVGVQFTWKLVDVPDPKWNFLIGNIEIRNRLYVTTVQETVKDNVMNLTKAELKSDLIIKKWVWNFDSYYNSLNLDISNTFGPNAISNFPKPYLSLGIHFTAVKPASNMFESFKNMTDSDEVEGHDDVNINGGSAGKLKLGEEENVDLELSNIKINGNPNLLPSLILEKNQTIGGFFRFVPNATVTYPTLSEQYVTVKGFFWPAGSQVKAVLIYPYFGNGTLEHDPSIGVVSRLSPEQPAFEVTVTGSNIAAKPIETTIPTQTSTQTSTQTTIPTLNPLIAPTLGVPTIIVGIILVTVICVLAIAVSRKKIDIFD